MAKTSNYSRKALYAMMKRLRYNSVKPLSQAQCDLAADQMLAILLELEGCINSMANQANTLSTHANNIDRMLR